MPMRADRLLRFALFAWATACNREPLEVRLDLTIAAPLGSAGTGLFYEPGELYVAASSRVALTLLNRTPAAGHNFVLVQPGSVEAVALAATSVAALPGHVPTHEAVLASSPLVAPGESTTFRFMAPPPGAYEFLCTEPGHPLLRGRLIVQ